MSKLFQNFFLTSNISEFVDRIYKTITKKKKKKKEKGEEPKQLLRVTIFLSIEQAPLQHYFGSSSMCMVSSKYKNSHQVLNLS